MILEKQHVGDTAEQLAAHEFDMLMRLKDEGCAPLPVEHSQAKLRLDMPEGVVLKDWILSGPPLTDKLRVAIALAQSLARIHAKGIVYRNLSSQHVVVELGASLAATWIHFERATRLSRLKQNATQPSQLKGELAYFSPELTGRINRVVDWRSDLYGLGVLLYELFSGILPFAAETPIEWVNAHLSQQPAPISSKDIPQTLVHIIMTLLAKNPEQRYASVQGLIHDLERLAAGEHEFPCRERDFSQTFALPDRVYGRAHELGVLEECIASINDSLQFVAVAAPSGMGKTALVEELKHSMFLKGAMLCSGKFDQFAQNEPFGALGQAIDELARQVMTWDSVAYEAWRKKVLKGLDGYGRLLTDLSPRLERILGEQPKLPEVDAELAARRVANTFFGFFAQCASSDCPVIFFIDDMQWSDSSTQSVLEMLKIRGSELRHILMIHAYRSDELNPKSAYAQWLQSVAIQTISLKPLVEPDVCDILHDGFGGRIAGDDLTKIAHLLFGRSAGSPFFLRELIATLIDQEAIHLDIVEAQWHFDQAAASKIELSSDVAELLLAKLQQVPEASRHALGLMSFVGRSFSLSQLKQCAELPSLSEAAKQLWPAIELDLIAPLDEGFQMLLTSDAGGADPSCRFVHDKVQAAARRQIPEEQHREIKRDIGLRLLGERDPLGLDREAIVLADLLAEAELVGQDAINRRLLQLRSGIFSRQAGQHSVALAFLDSAMSFQDAWLAENEDHTLIIADELADALRANGDIPALQELWQQVDDRIVEKLRGTRVTNALISAYAAVSRNREALDTYLRFLRAIDSGLPDKSGDLAIILSYRKAKKAIGDPKLCFANPKPATEKMRAIQHSLGAAGTAMVSEDPKLFARIMCDAARFAVTEGTIHNNYAGMYTPSAIASALGDLHYARELVEAAPPITSYLDESPEVAIHGYSVAPLFVYPYWNPESRETLILSWRFSDAAYRLGDLQHASNFLGYPVSFILYRGQSFTFFRESVQEAFANHARDEFWQIPAFEDTWNLLSGLGDASRQSMLGTILDYEINSDPLFIGLNASLQIMIRTLLGMPLNSRNLDNWRLTENCFVGMISSDMAYAFIEINKMRHGALPISTAKQKVSEFVKSKLFAARMKKIRGIGSDILDALTSLVLGCQAERRGATKKALTLYQEAYEAGGRAQSARDQLLAAEYSFRILRCTNREAALVWLQRMLVAAEDYSFMPKTSALREEFAEDIKELQALFPQLRGVSVEARASDDLDLATLIQAGADLAQAKDLQDLIAKALDIVVKNLSATRAQLWQIADGHWQRLGGDGTISDEFLDEIYRAQEIRVIDDASGTELSCQSALCIPMASGGQSIGLMVVENDTLTEAFPRSRLPFLRTLSSQIATAIANALLYAQMEEKVQEKARAMVAIMTHIEQGILTIEASGKIAEDYSQALPQILGLSQIAGRNAIEILFHQTDLQADVVDQVEATLFASLGEDVLNFEVNIDRLVRELSLRSGKIIELDWVPITDDLEEVRAIMVTLRDVTQVRASQAAAEASAKELQRIGSLLALSPRQANDFFADARARLEASKARVEQSPDPAAWLELNFRDLHTLKGVARSYQFLDLAAMIHEVEEPYQHARQSLSESLPSSEDLSASLVAVLALVADYERIEHEVLKRQGGSSALDLDRLRKASASRDWHAIDALLLEEQVLDLEALLRPVLGSLPALAQELGRPEPKVTFEIEASCLEQSIGTTLLGALTHVLRNSVDHGLKTADSGEIRLTVREETSEVIIFVEDAGRGLNLGALEQKLGPKSDEDLAEAIFQSGLSTNEQVSDISGRGVGMDAVRGAIEDLGGRVTIEFLSATRDSEGYRKHRLLVALPKFSKEQAA